jgi:hypothetical protein
MVKKELIKRSPIRILEGSIHGGLGKGNLGIIAAKKGVGKTAVLIHLATDQLFQGKHVIHVSFSSNTSHIFDWYEDIFSEIARRYDLDEAMTVHDDIIKNRVIMNFNQDGIRVDQIVRSLKAMIDDGHFKADVVVVDTFDFTRAQSADMQAFKTFAQQAGIEIWFSASLPPGPMNTDERGFPSLLSHVMPLVAILILLIPKDGFVHLELVKDHDKTATSNTHLKLDPKILLIAVEDV